MDKATEKKCCETCQYGYISKLDELVCVNRDSYYCTEWVENEDTCKAWEEKRSNKK